MGPLKLDFIVYLCSCFFSCFSLTKIILNHLFNFVNTFYLNNLKYFCQSSRKVDKSMLHTFEKVKELSKKKGLSLNQLEEKLGYSKNTLYSLKRQNVSTKRLQEIADYLNVSVDYLLGKTENPTIASNDQSDKIALNIEEMADNVMMFGGRELTEEKKKVIQSIIEAYLKGTE